MLSMVEVNSGNMEDKFLWDKYCFFETSNLIQIIQTSIIYENIEPIFELKKYDFYIIL